MSNNSIYSKKNINIRKNNFIIKSNIIHNNKYDYSLVQYVNSLTNVKIICPIHGVFELVPGKHVMGRGCQECGQNKRRNAKLYTNEQFVNIVNKIHNNQYIYTDMKYRGSRYKIDIMCPTHGIFSIWPNSHMKGQGCSICKGNRRDTKTFVEEVAHIHNNQYDYSLVNYVDTITPVVIICKSHGKFIQTPKSHLRGNGCPSCWKGNFSKIALKWLDIISEKENINIQHALNGGEYIIPGTKFRIDGYCKETNTVYEFYGDAFHGNPMIFGKNEKCHPFNDISAIELYKSTIERENIIKKLGYNIISIWENEFKQCLL